LDSKTTIPDALDALAFAGILSAPVKKFDLIIGMIDVSDLVGEVLRILRAHHNKNHMERIFKHTTLENVLDTRGGEKKARNAYKWTPLKASDNILNALRLMGTGIHRTPVTSTDGHELMGILSQTDIPRLISKYPHLLEGEYQTDPEGEGKGKLFKLSQLPVGLLPTLKKTPSIVRVSAQSPTWLALEALDSQHLSAVAIVDDPLSLSPKLIGTFSSNNIKALTASSFHYLLLPVEQFLTLVNPDKEQWSGARCGPDYPLLEILRKLACTSVIGGSHRIWLTEADGTLLGLLSLTDIIQFLFSL